MNDWRYFFREFYRSLLVWAVAAFVIGLMVGDLVWP
jgi:hypothetical protein